MYFLFLCKIHIDAFTLWQLTESYKTNINNWINMHGLLLQCCVYLRKLWTKFDRNLFRTFLGEEVEKTADVTKTTLRQHKDTTITFDLSANKLKLTETLCSIKDTSLSAICHYGCTECEYIIDICLVMTISLLGQ